MNRSIQTIFLLVTFGLVGVFLAACGPPEPSIENADKLANKVVKKIGREYKLNDDQKARLFAMYVDFKQNEELRGEYVALIDSWIKELTKPTMAEEAVLELMRRKHELDMKGETRLASQLTELHTTLDSEQRDRIIEKLMETRAWLVLGLDDALYVSKWDDETS